MRSYDIFKEYIWLVQTIHRHKNISLGEINELWRKTDMSGGLEYSRTTFNRHKAAIEDIFGIFIECKRKNGYKYFIGNSNVLEEDSVQNWMLSTLSVNNIISSGLSVQDRIQIESIPNVMYLQEMVDAMKKSCKVKAEYRRFGAEDSKTHIFCPYALKAYEKRWYVLAFFEARRKENGEIRDAHFAVFSLDRFEKLVVMDEKFQMDRRFKMYEFYRDNYGIVPGEKTPTETVVLRAYGREAYSLRSLPLHHSQQEKNATSEYSDFELCIKPTLDFAGKILSRGEWIEVVKPEWFRNQIQDMIEKAARRYRKDV